MRHKLWQIWWAFTRLGLTSFGGPAAHIGYFHHEFVTRRGWLSNDEFAQDNALCQLVPGPASSQLGMLIGARQAGVWGSIVAWIGFTTPSAIIMLLVMQEVAGSTAKLDLSTAYCSGQPVSSPTQSGRWLARFAAHAHDN